MNLVMQIVSNNAKIHPQVHQALSSMPFPFRQVADGGTSRIGEWGTDLDELLRFSQRGKAFHTQSTQEFLHLSHA